MMSVYSRAIFFGFLCAYSVFVIILIQILGAVLTAVYTLYLTPIQRKFQVNWAQKFAWETFFSVSAISLKAKFPQNVLTFCKELSLKKLLR